MARAEPVWVYPAAVSLVSARRRGSCGFTCARGRLFEGEKHAAGRTRTNAGAVRTGERSSRCVAALAEGKQAPEVQGSRLKGLDPVASSITTYVGISRSPQAKKEMEKRGRRSRACICLRKRWRMPNGTSSQTGQIPDKVGLLEYADNVVKKLPRARC